MNSKDFKKGKLFKNKRNGVIVRIEGKAFGERNETIVIIYHKLGWERSYRKHNSLACRVDVCGEVRTLRSIGNLRFEPITIFIDAYEAAKKEDLEMFCAKPSNKHRVSNG